MGRDERTPATARPNRLPPPPPPRRRPAAPAHRRQPAGRSRLVAGALSALAFFGLVTGMAVRPSPSSAEPATDAVTDDEGGASRSTLWPQAVPGLDPGGLPTTSTHAS